MIRAPLLLAVLLMLPGLAGAQTIYKWRDASGNLHFSDRPREGAEKVELRRPSTYDSPTPATVPAASAPEQPPADVIPYRRFAFAQPAPEATIRQSSLSVAIQLEPALRQGHQVRLLLDGAPIATAADTVFPLQGIERGAHTVAAQILDERGQAIAYAGPITFYVHLPSVLKRPN